MSESVYALFVSVLYFFVTASLSKHIIIKILYFLQVPYFVDADLLIRYTSMYIYKYIFFLYSYITYHYYLSLNLLMSFQRYFSVDICHNYKRAGRSPTCSTNKERSMRCGKGWVKRFCVKKI